MIRYTYCENDSDFMRVFGRTLCRDVLGMMYAARIYRAFDAVMAIRPFKIQSMREGERE